jgi:fatty acid desaturase
VCLCLRVYLISWGLLFMSVCNSVTVKELTYVKDDAPGMAQLARNFCALVLVMVCVCVCVCVCVVTCMGCVCLLLFLIQ